MKNSLLNQAADLDNLRLAWEEIASNKGISGVDNISIKKWGRQWENRINKLSIQVRTNTYFPLPLRKRRIPKKNQVGWRVLRIPTVTDRVLMRAVLNILHPVVDRTFLDCSFGYRPRRGLKNAINRIIILRSNEYLWVLDADIDDLFNQVDQEMLMAFLTDDLPDKSLLQLFDSWLKLCRPDPQIPRGIPMGSPISPLLANIYLHRLDCKIIQDGYETVRYADDFLVFARREQRIRQAYVNVKTHLDELRLTFEPSKTRLTSFEKGFHFIGVWFINDEYKYTYRDKRIEVEGDRVDWLFGQYGPHC